MDKNETKNELIKRYAYLYENKECILALCAGKTEDENYYLNKSASADALTVFEEFLFTDRNIENTELFKYIELLKLSSKYYAAVNDVVERIEQRRQSDSHLSKLQTFTVWKILTYVRDNNLENKAVLNALDKYYNIDRYMLSYKNYTSGYILNEADEFIISNNDYPSMYPSVNLEYTNGDEAHTYYFSEYEREDNYYDTKGNDKVKHYKPTSLFMGELSTMDMISERDKQELYFRLNSKNLSYDRAYRMSLNGWYSRGQDMLIALTRFHVSIKQINNDGYVYYKIVVRDYYGNDINISFYSLQEAIEFTERSIIECENLDEVLNRYREVHAGYPRLYRNR